MTLAAMMLPTAIPIECPVLPHTCAAKSAAISRPRLAATPDAVVSVVTGPKCMGRARCRKRPIRAKRRSDWLAAGRIIWPMVEPEIERIARTYGIRLLLQFGSTVGGATHPRSDVDLAVLVERAPLSLEEHSRLLHELQRLFPDREVDLAVLNHADPLFLEKVMERCRLLYGAPRELRRLQLYAFRRYQDHRKYLDLERRFVAKAITGSPGSG